jgi:3-deoxy-7-phosphoheptulonate synthase
MLFVMILPKSTRLTPEQLAEVTAIVTEFGCKIQPIIGAVRSIYAIVGDERDELMINRLEGLDYVERIDRIQSPFKLMDRRSDLATHRIKVAGVTLGTELFVVAGNCTIDPKNPNYFYETAAAVKEAGAQHDSRRRLEAAHESVFVPRRREVPGYPDGRFAPDRTAGRHRGDGGSAHQARPRCGRDLPAGRRAQRAQLLAPAGDRPRGRGSSRTVVLLKRSIHMGPINEFISAAEYIAAFGNPNVILCPRGTTPTLEGYRNHPDESITPLLKEKTWAPVIVDPSHSVGKASYVPACALAAVAYGADGLCIEAHVSPSHGIGDDPKQALTPEVLATTIRQAKALWALRRGV